MKVVKYEHHGSNNSVQEHLKGKHREHNLCFQGCKHFKIGSEDNCEIAKDTFKNCVKHNVVSPVWECPKYEKI